MHLTALQLINFKNYETQRLELSPKLNCFVGKNGMGKTNLLDAIYYLCMCKSHFVGNDKFIVRHQEDFFRLVGDFVLKDAKETIVAKVMPRKRKDFERNKKVYGRLSEHIGLLPVVLIAPNDTLLATEGSEERRRFLDNTLCQLDADYLKHLISYNKLLKQRNSLLKQFGEQRYFDAALLEVYDSQLLTPATFIHEKRTVLLASLLPIFNDFYQKIANQQEEVNCIYQSKLSTTSFQTLLAEAVEKDRILQRTTVGIHKDDLNFTINGFPLKKFASQGQLKSFILALKLAQYELLRQQKTVSPILLLDDVFDKLDKYRVQQLLALLHETSFGQIFVTDTHEHRLEQIAQGFEQNYKKFVIENGKVIHVSTSS